MEDVDDLPRVVDAERGLGEVDDLVRIGDLDALRFFARPDDANRARSLA